MRKISNKIVITAIVNYKCVGHFGKCIKSLALKERVYVIDTLIERGYLTEKMIITKEGDEVIKRNLDLLQH